MAMRGVPPEKEGRFMSVAQRLLALMLSGDVLDERVQWRILREGSRTRDAGLLTSLVRHPALVPEVDEALGEVALASVRAAWLTRPARPLPDVTSLIRGEKRVTVLAAILDTPGVPEEAIETASERLSCSKVLPLLSRDDLSMGLREKLARMFTEKTTASSRVLSNQLAALPNDPGLIRIILEGTNHCGLAAHCLSVVDASPQDIERVIGLACDALDPARAAEVRPPDEWLSALLAGLSGHVVTTEQRMSLEMAVQGSSIHSWEKSNVVTDVRSLTSSNVSREECLVALGACATPEQVLELLKVVSLHRLPLLPFAKAAYTLPQVPPEVFRALIRSIKMPWRNLRLLWSCKSDPVKTALLYLEHPWLDFAAVENGPDGAATVEAIVCACAQDGSVLPHEVQASRHLTGELLSGLPVGALLLLNEQAATKLSGAVADRLVEAVSDDAQWAVLRVLADEFQGSLPELLDTAEVL